MKKALITVVITMATILILTTTGVIKQTQRQYGAEAVVIGVEGNTITVIDTTGNEREFYGEGFEIGDRITITLQDYNTRTPTDDEIVGAR